MLNNSLATKEIEYLSADDEDRALIAQSNAKLDKNSIEPQRILAELFISSGNLAKARPLVRGLLKQEEKTRLKKLIRSIKPHGYGVIIRTVATGKKVAELDQDLKNLYKKWQVISKKLKDTKAPLKILGELNRSSTILRDLLDAKFNNIVVNNKEIAQELKDYLARISPEQEKIVKLHNGEIPIFQKYNIKKEQLLNLHLCQIIQQQIQQELPLVPLIK